MKKFLELLKNKLTEFFHSECFKSIAAAIICSAIGIVVGYIILLCINAENATKGITTILKNFMFYTRPAKRMEYFASTLIKSVPLILCGLSVLFAYKAGLFNIGVGGQYCVAIGVSLWCALALHLPWWLCVILASTVSALWGALVGIFKAFFNVNEVIACIMFNWIGLYLVNIFLSNEAAMNLSKSETYKIRAVSRGSLIPTLGLDNFFHNRYMTISFIITIIVAIIIAIVLDKTKFGYELKATGLNKNAAKYAGMKEKLNIVLTMAISGAIAGLAASLFYLTDIQQWKTVASIPAMGFNGIAVAFLGGLNPIGVIFAGFFIEHITLGGSLLDMRYFNPQIADLISAVIIYSCAFVLFIKEVMTKQMAKKEKAVLKDSTEGGEN